MTGNPFTRLYLRLLSHCEQRFQEANAEAKKLSPERSEALKGGKLNQASLISHRRRFYEREQAKYARRIFALTLGRRSAPAHAADIFAA